EIYEARLQAEGYDIVSARDGEEALVVAKAEKPDLVISDVMMPKISGFEMLDILRNTEGLKDVKVIMLTALGQSDDQQRADRLGADRYLVKSQVTLEDIVKVSHELLEGTDGTAAAPPPAAPTPPSAPTPPASPPAEPPTAPPTTDSSTAASAAPQATPVSAVPTTAVPATPAPTTIPVAPAPPAAGTAASDDKLMADVVDKLLASTDDKQTPADPATATTAPPVTTNTSSADNSSTTEVAAAAPDVVAEEEVSSQVPVAHKKVIEPLDSP